MSKTIQIPLGSQHVALLEPMRLKFTAENETIVDVEADFGYVHRGIEQACQSKFKFRQISYVVSRVCGLCSITHASCYTFAIEEVMKVEVTKRAQYLRVIAFELDRIHSHMLCLAHTAESAGFEALFMRIMRDREPVMEMQEIMTGNRVHFDYVSIGGVNRDFTSEMGAEFKKRMVLLKRNLEEIKDLFENNWSLSLKYKGIGAITKEESNRLNALGPIARAAGCENDVRSQHKVLPYDELGYKMVVESGGDVHGRNMVRLRECINSVEMIENAINNLPEGEIEVKVKGNPDGEAVMRIEAPRGELAYYVKGVKKPVLDRVRIKTPTYSNLPAYMHIFKGQEYANVPAILASFDPCMSCTAK